MFNRCGIAFRRQRSQSTHGKAKIATVSKISISCCVYILKMLCFHLKIRIRFRFLIRFFKKWFFVQNDWLQFFLFSLTICSKLTLGCVRWLLFRRSIGELSIAIGQKLTRIHSADWFVCILIGSWSERLILLLSVFLYFIMVFISFFLSNFFLFEIEKYLLSFFKHSSLIKSYLIRFSCNFCSSFNFFFTLLSICKQRLDVNYVMIWTYLQYLHENNNKNHFAWLKITLNYY